MKELCPRCNNYEMVTMRKNFLTFGFVLILVTPLSLIVCFITGIGIFIAPFVLVAEPVLGALFILTAFFAKGSICKKCGYKVIPSLK